MLRSLLKKWSRGYKYDLGQTVKVKISQEMCTGIVSSIKMDERGVIYGIKSLRKPDNTEIEGIYISEKYVTT